MGRMIAVLMNDTNRNRIEDDQRIADAAHPAPFQGRAQGEMWIWWKRAGIVIALAGLAGWIWAAQLENHYQETLPRSTNSVTGSIYPLNVHGIVVYQTRDERNWLKELHYSSFAVFLIGGLMGLVYEKRYGRPPIPPKPWTPGPGWRSHLP